MIFDSSSSNVPLRAPLFNSCTPPKPLPSARMLEPLLDNTVTWGTRHIATSFQEAREGVFQKRSVSEIDMASVTTISQLTPKSLSFDYYSDITAFFEDFYLVRALPVLSAVIVSLDSVKATLLKNFKDYTEPRARLASIPEVWTRFT